MFSVQALPGNCIFSSEYDKARALLGQLMARYDGIGFDALFTGNVVSNEGGNCMVLESRHDLPSVVFDTGA